MYPAHQSVVASPRRPGTEDPVAKSDWTAAWDQMEYSEDADALWASRTRHLPVSSGIGARERSDMIAAVSLQLRMPIPAWDPNPRA